MLKLQDPKTQIGQIEGFSEKNIEKLARMCELCMKLQLRKKLHFCTKLQLPTKLQICMKIRLRMKLQFVMKFQHRMKLQIWVTIYLTPRDQSS